MFDPPRALFENRSLACIRIAIYFKMHHIRAGRRRQAFQVLKGCPVYRRGIRQVVRLANRAVSTCKHARQGSILAPHSI